MLSRRQVLSAVVAAVPCHRLRADGSGGEYRQRAETIRRVLLGLGLDDSVRFRSGEDVCRLILATDEIWIAAECAKDGLSAGDMLDSSGSVVSHDELARLIIERMTHPIQAGPLNVEIIEEVLCVAEHVMVERFTAQTEAEVAPR